MRTWLVRTCTALLFFCGALGVSSARKTPADFPLRLHIFNRNQTSFYHHRYLDETEGQGHADLFIGDDVRGVDFTYDCSEKIHASMAMETYPARWHKPGRVLTVLFPVFGKSGQYFTCNFNTDVKDYAYFVARGHLQMETPAAFKTWMTQHNYNPVNEQDFPTPGASTSEFGASGQ